MKKLFLLACFTWLFSSTSFAFDTWWHAECTRKAMVANGFSSDARLATQFSNYLTDFFPALSMLDEKLASARRVDMLRQLKVDVDPSVDYMHFDAIFTTADIEQNWKMLLNNTIYALKKYAASPEVRGGFRLPVLFNIIGASLHTVQDFYSHSNWVNLHVSMNKPVPVWFEADSLERSQLKLFTGAYPDGSAKGHANHSDLNKDCSTRPFNKEAVEAAERASIDWVKRLMDSVTNVPWAELKAYNIQRDVVMKRFLVQLDATFLTSSSIVLSHFDGAKPVKFVFAADRQLPREKTQALAALNLTLSQYATNIALEGNIYHLPSPYWAGFKVYRITKDLAAGLSLKGKKYVAGRRDD